MIVDIVLFEEQSFETLDDAGDSELFYQLDKDQHVESDTLEMHT